MCLKNCLMIGIMMPVGVSCLSTLSPMNTGKKKTDPADAKQAPHPPPGCLLVLLLPFKAVQSSSRQSELYHIRRFVTVGTFVTMSPPEEQPFHAPA